MPMTSVRYFWYIFFPILVQLTLLLFKRYNQYGYAIFSTTYRQMDEDGEHWDKVMKEKTPIFVGGHHAGGTTLLWKLIREHEEIGSFGFDDNDKFTGARATGSDYAEGSFLQSIMPTFSVGRGGQCRYAKTEEGKDWGELGDKSKALITDEKRTQLLNEWGYHWKENGAFEDGKKYLLEKTPTNAVTARWLYKLFNLGKEEGRGVSPRFVFVQRHPLATAMSQKKWPRCKGLSNFDLVAHWVEVSRRMSVAVKELGSSVAVVKLEDLTERPKAEVNKVLQGLGVAPFGKKEEFKTRIRKDPNKRYQDAYCRQIYTNSNVRMEHVRIKDAFSKAAKEWGYDLDLNDFCK